MKTEHSQNNFQLTLLLMLTRLD